MRWPNLLVGTVALATCLGIGFPLRALDALPGAQPQRRALLAEPGSKPKGGAATHDAGTVSICPSSPPSEPLPPTILSSAQAGTVRRDLPLGSGHDPNVSYTAPEPGGGASVRFRYRLAGVDKDWQDAGPRRQALYLRLPGGQYRFEVEAGNRGGLWSAPVALSVDVAPRLTETAWFRTLASVALLGLVYMGWRTRLHQLTTSLRIRLDERSAVARDMHDTLLQAAQAMAYRLDVIAAHQNGAPAREELLALAAYARQTIEEGRSRLEALRAEHEDDRTPVSALVRLGNELGGQGGPKLVWGTSGKPRAVNPLVGANIRSVGREMLSNAFFHANASEIRLHADFGRRRFTLTVEDDGCGVDMAAAGAKPGHFGLRAMHERTLDCGGRLCIRRLERGTLATMTVPAIRVYARPWKKKLETFLLADIFTRSGRNGGTTGH